MLDRLGRQVRYAIRVLVRAPLYTLTAALSLAIGLGANMTIFTIANALLLVPTHGVRDMDRLVDLGRTTNGQGFDTVSYPTYADLRDHNTSSPDVRHPLRAQAGQPRRQLTAPIACTRCRSAPATSRSSAFSRPLADSFKRATSASACRFARSS